MSVSSSVQLPAQPASGRTVFTPLGGDGIGAPLACYLVDIDIAGDAGGGVASLQIFGDPRFTNLVAWMNIKATSAATATDFLMQIEDAVSTTVPKPQIVGTLPQIDPSLFGANAAFLWYPPPIYFPGTGNFQVVTENVDATEVYTLALQVYCFNVDVLQLTPLPFLQWNVPGVSAPAAI